MIDQSDLESAVPDLEALLVEMIASVLGEQAEASTDTLPDAISLAVSRLAIYNPTDGSFLGIEVRAESGLVTTLAGSLLGVPEPAPDDMLDVIAELGNIAAGNVKSLLCHNGHLSLPSAKLAFEHAMNPHGTIRVAASLWGSVVELAVMPMISADPGTRWPPGSAPEESTQAQPA
jgi:hypothetical protein